MLCIFNDDWFPQNKFHSHHTVAIPMGSILILLSHQCRREIISQLIPSRLVPGTPRCHATKCECTFYCGVFVCRGTLQLLHGGGDMVQAILMQCPPLPDSALILLFPFHCDSCWDWLPWKPHLRHKESPAGVDWSVRYHIL